MKTKTLLFPRRPAVQRIVRFRLGSLLVLAGWCAALWGFFSWDWKNTLFRPADRKELAWPEFFSKHLAVLLPETDGFDFPVRPPDGDDTYIARKFGEDNHLGEDWNTAEENKDLGEPIFSCGEGWVSLAMDFQGAWGKVVMVTYRLGPGRWPAIVEMMYAHLQEIDVQPFQFVKRGQKIGTMGNADGVYWAHLHWEVRQGPGLGLGGGYADRLDGWLDPSQFVLAHRPPGASPAPPKHRVPKGPKKDDMD